MSLELWRGVSCLPRPSGFKKKKKKNLLGSVYDLCRVGRGGEYGGEWSRKVLLGVALWEGAGPSLKVTSGLPWPPVR